MPYAIYQVFEDSMGVRSQRPVATLTDDEMLAIGRLRGLRFQLLMTDDVGAALDKLSPAFYKVAESRMDRRLRELQGSDEPCSHNEATGTLAREQPCKPRPTIVWDRKTGKILENNLLPGEEIRD
jgi:hypothetical protein